MGAVMNIAVEHVARAFHAVQEDSVAWENEPEILKEEFRAYAREALVLYAEIQAKRQVADGNADVAPESARVAA
jgi:hypothetical protein